MRYPTVMLALGFVMGWPPLIVAEESLAVPRAAIVDFTSDDGLWRSGVAAANYASLIQAALAGDQAVEWIERGQLQKAAAEMHMSLAAYTSGASALRLGKWLKADLLVMGRFLRNEKEGHTLLLEIIDVQRADVIAQRSVPIPGNRRDVIVVDPAIVESATQALKDALKEGAGAFAAIKKKKVVAPLFFRNVDPSPRLNFLEPELQDALQQAMAKSPRIRITRFPRATEALGENELVLLGLTETNVDAWQKVADLYVWGSYHEVKSEGLAFEKVPVEFTLCLWDGAGQPTTICEKSTVAQMASLKERLVRKILESVDRASGVNPSGQARATAAKWLMDQAAEIRRTLVGLERDTGESRATAEGRALVQYVVRTIETACFFCPGDREIRYQTLCVHDLGIGSFLPHQWSLQNKVEPSSFFQQWRRSNELGDFARQFNESTGGYISSLFELLETLQRREITPVDATGDDLAAWGAVIEKEITELILAYGRKPGERQRSVDDIADDTCGVWLCGALKNFSNPQLTEQIVDRLWPRYKLFYAKQIQKGSGDYLVQRMKPLLTRFYSSLNRPNRAIELLDLSQNSPATPLLAGQTQPSAQPGEQPPSGASGTPSPSLAATNSPVKPGAPATAGRPAVVVPGSTQPVDRYARFPQPRSGWRPLAIEPCTPLPPNPMTPTWVYTIKTLFPSGDFIWFTAERLTVERGQVAKTHALWRYRPASDSLENISQRLGNHSAVTSLVEAEGKLWLTMQSDGVWCLEPETLAVRKFDAKDGVVSPNMFASAVDGRRLYLGGRHQQKESVNVVELGSLSWGRLDLSSAASPSAGNTPGAFHLNPHPALLQCFSPYRQWLIMGIHPWVLYDSVKRELRTLREALHLPPPDPKVVEKKRMQKMMGPMHSMKSMAMDPWWIEEEILACSSDKNGYWIGLETELRFFDPATGRQEKWGLPETVNASLCQDGEYLWLACSTLEKVPSPSDSQINEWRTSSRRDQGGVSHLLVFHKSKRQWVAHLEIPGRATALAISRGTVFLGLQHSPAPLLELNRTAILAIPPDQWVATTIP